MLLLYRPIIFVNQFCFICYQEGENMTYGQLSNSSEQGSIGDLSLYSSPSMPNISLGRPPAPSSSRVNMLELLDLFHLLGL